MAARRAFITGASGFVGSNLLRALLADGYEVHGLVRAKSASAWRLPSDAANLHLHEGDITDEKFLTRILKEIAPHEVYHLAHYGGYRGQDDVRMIRNVCIDGTQALYNACAQINSIEGIVHAGSSSEYGVKPESMREDMVLEPHTEYGIAKAWATLYGQMLARQNILPITTVRLFAVYGPYEAATRLVPAAVLAALRNTTMNLSDPTATRDFVYIDDVIAALRLVATGKHSGSIYNIGGGAQTTIKDMVDLIAQAAHVSLDIHIGTIAGRNADVPFWQADISQATAELGWKPTHTLKDGVAKTVTWFTQNQTLYT